MDEHERFALMLREALTEYDFEAIRLDEGEAYVRLNREVFAMDGKEEKPEFTFNDPAIIRILAALRGHLPLV
ncbi:MAG: hypothetical protein ACYC1U_05060 [Candidatus Aquicultorales bacterium]